jgi:acyl dehydratase
VQRPEAGAMPVGYYAELSRSFSMDDVRGFAQLSGDDNPIHVDEKYAATTRFKK